MASEFPFDVEYAKSNRSSCKACKSPIDKDEIRLGIMVQSPHFDGRIPMWHHWNCFWKKARVSDVADIHGLDRLRWEDQEKIRSKIGGGNGASAGATSDAAAELKASDFAVEYSKNAMAKCKKCETKIGKGEIRVSKKGFGFFHFKCFAENFNELPVKFSVDAISGFGDLKEEDQKDCLKIVKPLKRQASDQNGTSTKPKKSKRNDDEQQAASEEDEERKKLKKQSDALWKIKDDLQKNLSNKEMAELLTANDQEVPVASAILDRLADCMFFGPLLACKECQGGQVVYSSTNNSYICTGSISAFTKCQFSSQDPSRGPLEIPHEMKEDFPYL